jgi:DNA N-6-adenine-methyltransferase (Dam)
MNKFKGLMTSLSPHWKTPSWLYEELNKEFCFDFDPCPLQEQGFDGLNIEWGKCNFVNPPYGRAIKAWIKKAYEESLKGNVCVLLLPARTDTSWYHDYVLKAKEIRFIRGRLKFGNAVNSAPFPSMVVVFDCLLALNIV